MTKPRKRPAISDGMRYRALKLHCSVLVRCFDCLQELVRLRVRAPDESFIDDTAAWHKLDNIEFDHVWELADGGKNRAKDLRPKCVAHHKQKSKAAEKMRHHLDRASKKARGVFKRKSPPIKSRGFQKTLTKRFDGKVVVR